MKYIADKVQAGVIDLSQIPTHMLQQMVIEATSEKDRNCLSCELFYRKET